MSNSGPTPHLQAHRRMRQAPFLLTCALFAIVAVCIPAYGSAYTIQLATDIVQAIVLAYSWNLLAGYTGYISFGHVSFFGIGAYATALLVLHTPIPWYIAVFLGGAVAVVVALIVGPVMLRLRGILFALGMLGLARILETLFTDWNYPGGASGTVLIGTLTPVAVYALMVLTAAAAFATTFFFTRSGFGLDAMSIREDEDAAIALGVPANKVKTIVLAISALFPAIAGGLTAWNRSYIDPPSAFDPTIDLLAIVFVLFGGIGTLWGPLIGASTLMILAELLLVRLPSLKLALYGLIVIGIVLLLPGGIISLINRMGWLKRKPVHVLSEFPVDFDPRTLGSAGGTRTEGPVLDLKNLSVRFGGHIAVNDVSFQVGEGEILCIIGANGAGKTTLFNAITGAVPLSQGSIHLHGRDITALPLSRRVHLGIARTFQIPRLLTDLTVWENVLVAARHGRQAHRALEHSAWVLRILGLESLKLQRASALSPGRQRELELARVLAVQPDIVLLDEVMAGMTRDEQQTVRQVIRQLPDLGVHAVICVEHVISAVADLSDKMLVLDFGRKIAHDVPDKVLNDPAVVKAYLGDAGSGRRGMTDHDTAPGNSPQPERSNETAALTVESVSAGIGPLTILQDISFSVYPGEVVVILGANGAGKTTLLRVIAGLLPAREGQVRLYGNPLHRKSAHLVTRLGIGHVPSGRELFPKLSVADHLTLAGRLCAPERRADVRKRVLDMFPILEQQAHQLVGTMSGGQQQMVAIARALMTDPKVLLLDEPSTGLAPIAVTAVFETLPILRAHGVSTILAEQSLTLGLSHADRAFVMDHGHIVLSGTARELENDRRVIDTYLGR